jgi:hypothetical protein
MNMSCTEGDVLKSEVLDKIEEYLAAEKAQFDSSNFDEEALRARAELAHVALSDTRRRYWEHIKQHGCDPAAILSVDPGTIDSIAV